MLLILRSLLTLLLFKVLFEFFGLSCNLLLEELKEGLKLADNFDFIVSVG